MGFTPREHDVFGRDVPRRSDLRPSGRPVEGGELPVGNVELDRTVARVMFEFRVAAAEGHPKR